MPVVRDPRYLHQDNFKTKIEGLVGKRDWNKLIYLLRDMNESKSLETLEADRTYYVRKDGNDANNGRSDNADGAFLTIQAALDNLTQVHLGTYAVTIQVGAGTYSEDIVFTHANKDKNAIILLGDATTPANVIIDAYYQAFTATGVAMTINGFTITTTYASATYGNGIVVNHHGYVKALNITFGGVGLLTWSLATGGQGESAGGIILSGDYAYYAACNIGSFLNIYGTIAIPTARAYTDFILCQNGGMVSSFATFSGAGLAGTTGREYFAKTNAIIDVFGAGAGHFPGDAAGATETGGLYV